MYRNTVHWRHYIRKMLHIYKSYKGMITRDAKIMKYKTKQKYHTVATIPKSNIEVVERGKIDTSLPPLTHKYMTAHLCGLVQRTLITQHKQRCSSRFFREVRVDHLFNFLCRVFLLVFVLRLVPYISCVSGLFILEYPSVFSHVVYVQGSVSSKTSQ